jgi:hypothetical protein
MCESNKSLGSRCQIRCARQGRACQHSYQRHVLPRAQNPHCEPVSLSSLGCSAEPFFPGLEAEVKTNPEIPPPQHVVVRGVGTTPCCGRGFSGIFLTFTPQPGKKGSALHPREDKPTGSQCEFCPWVGRVDGRNVGRLAPVEHSRFGTVSREIIDSRT